MGFSALHCIFLVLAQAGSHGNRVLHFQTFQKRDLVLNNSFTLVYASIMILPKTAEA